jgi:hypothetical protein
MVNGLVLSLLFGGLNVFQFVRDYIKEKVRQGNKDHIKAMKLSLQEIRNSCGEAIATNEAIKSGAARDWVRQLMTNLRGVEHHIDVLIGIKNSPLVESDSRSLSLVNTWIKSGNEMVKKIIETPGIPSSVQYGGSPPPDELTAEVNEWIRSTKSKVAQKFPWFSGQFANDAGVFSANRPNGLNGKDQKFVDLYEMVEYRLIRLGQLLSRVG